MARKPVGTQIRPIGEWFRHSRGRTGGYAVIQTDSPAAIGLINQDQSGRICYVLGIAVSIFVEQPGIPIGIVCGDYYQPTLEALGAPDEGAASPTEAWFDQDPMPPVAADFGYAPALNYQPPFILPVTYVSFTDSSDPANVFASAGVVYEPLHEVAAIKVGRGFYIAAPFTDPGDIDTLTVYFDFVMLPD